MYRLIISGLIFFVISELTYSFRFIGIFKVLSYISGIVFFYIFYRAAVGTFINILEKQNMDLACSLVKTGTWEFNLKENKIEISKEVYLLSGLDPEKTELNIDAYGNLIIPEDRIRFNNYLNKSLFNEKSIFDTEYTIIHAEDHKERVHRIKAKLLKPGRLIGIIQDVTSWKKIEDNLLESITKFTLLFNQMLDGFVFHKITYNEEDEKIYYCFTDVNPAFERITGLKRNEVINKNISDIPSEIGNRWIAVYNEVMQKHKTVQLEDFFPEIKKYLAMTAFSFKKGYLVTIISDITEKIVLLHKLKESEARFRNIIECAEAGYYNIVY